MNTTALGPIAHVSGPFRLLSPVYTVHRDEVPRYLPLLAACMRSRGRQPNGETHARVGAVWASTFSQPLPAGRFRMSVSTCLTCERAGKALARDLEQSIGGSATKAEVRTRRCVGIAGRRVRRPLRNWIENDQSVLNWPR
jgi:hypothetical protein